jgi:ubiquinone biosynthesis protein UbiJ
MTDSLELVLRPIANLLNRNIVATTPARELCEQLSGTIVAIRVRDTALAMYFTIGDGAVELSADSDSDPDVVITGSLLTLARIAGTAGEQAIRDGSLELTGDAETAQAFQTLLGFAAPDIEEELSGVIGDVAAHRLGETARGVRNWARAARSTMASNIREYVQEESRDVPSRYETERFSSRVDSLRDDVDRLEARLNRLNPLSDGD